LKFSILTIFPQVIREYASVGVLSRALQRDLIQLEAVDVREFTSNNYRSVDDSPFGGGAGMLMTPEPIAQAIEAQGPVDRRILLAPHGRPFDQALAQELAGLDSLLLLCGRYEGIDERVIESHIDEVVSLGDFVLTGGELAALSVMDATMRLLPGVLGNADSLRHESFAEGLLEHPHYTRPALWRGKAVPEVLLSGHHAHIEAWRRQASLQRTQRRRPELFGSAELDLAERQYLLDQAIKPEEIKE